MSAKFNFLWGCLYLYLLVKSALNDYSFSEIQLSPGDFVDVRFTNLKQTEKTTKLTTEEQLTKGKQETKENEAEESNQGVSLFTCPNEGCVSTFQMHYNLEHHLLYGKCKLAAERLQLLDKAKILYAETLLEGLNTQPSIPGLAISKSNTDKDKLSIGWALKSTKTSARFNENQKQYLDERFRIGQQTGHKANPVQVAQDMRHTKDEAGIRRFKIKEFLTSQQIQSYFSRKAAKLRHEVEKDESDDQAVKNALAVEDQVAYSNTRSVIIQECQLFHPITFDTHNICDMYAKNKIKNLTIAKLRLICEHFDLEIDHLPETRKAPYVKLISDLVTSCLCVSI